MGVFRYIWGLDADHIKVQNVGCLVLSSFKSVKCGVGYAGSIFLFKTILETPRFQLNMLR